jgi:hypothetical protein
LLASPPAAAAKTGETGRSNFESKLKNQKPKKTLCIYNPDTDAERETPKADVDKDKRPRG